MKPIKITKSSNENNTILTRPVFLKGVINLTSAPDTYITERLNGLGKPFCDTKILNLIPRITHDKISGRIDIATKRNKLVCYCVDVDDRSKNVKIRNINLMNGYVKAVILEFQKPDKNGISDSTAGSIVNIATRHFSMLQMGHYSVGFVPDFVKKNIMNVRIIKPTSVIFGSSAALEQMLQNRGIYYEIAEVAFKDSRSWMLMSITDLKNTTLDNLEVITEGTLNLEKDWRKKTCFSDRLMTENTMYSLVRYRRKQNKQPSKLQIDSDLLHDTELNQLLNSFNSVFNNLISMLNRIIGFITRLLVTKENQKTKNKINVFN